MVQTLSISLAGDEHQHQEVGCVHVNFQEPLKHIMQIQSSVEGTASMLLFCYGNLCDKSGKVVRIKMLFNSVHPKIECFYKTK